MLTQSRAQLLALTAEVDLTERMSLKDGDLHCGDGCSKQSDHSEKLEWIVRLDDELLTQIAHAVEDTAAQHQHVTQHCIRNQERTDTE